MPAILPRPIALVGMMGAGKTSVGRTLAARLGWRFVDSDEEVERTAGCSIAELFEREGEAAFRRRERAIVAQVMDGSLLVLATGGGAMAEPETRALLLEHAVTVWLRAEPEVLARRIGRPANRPLLEDSAPLTTLRLLSATREQAYAAADIQIDTKNRTVGDVTAAILATVTI